MAKVTRKLVTEIIFFSSILIIVNLIFDYVEMKKLIQSTYDEFLAQISMTASSYFDADKIDKYISEGDESTEYKDAFDHLHMLTQTMNASFIYLIKPDLPDCGEKTYVFNTVNNNLLNKYHPYPAGFREKSSDSSAQRYKKIMEQGIPIVDYDYFSHVGARARISMPVKNSSGETVAIVCVEHKLDDISRILHRYVRADMIYGPIAGIFFVILISFFLSRHFIRPIIDITKETDSFISQNAHFSGKLQEIHTKDEIETLARAIYKMGIDLQEYIKNLMQITSEKERISVELAVATGIQDGMLPKNFSPYQEHPEVELFASMVPAKEVGGDFYDFFFSDSHTLWLVIGDVSGKGIPAAMFMVVSKALIKNYAMQKFSPGEVLTRTNAQLSTENPQGLFVTTWIARIDLETGEMIFSNAGHNAPIIYNDGKLTFLREVSGIMLAALDNTQYKEHKVQLAKYSGLFIYTDGVTEATDTDHQLFGEEQLFNVISKFPGNTEITSRVLIEKVSSEIEKFKKGAAQFDDITMLSFMLKELDDSENTKTRVFDADDKYLDEVLAFAKSSVKTELSPETDNKIDLAVEEIFVNIAHYAYKDGNGKVKIVSQLKDNPERLCIDFSDQGVPFNPLEKPDPDITLSAEERNIGGLGIFLTKKFMDKVEYRFENGSNILYIEKKL